MTDVNFPQDFYLDDVGVWRLKKEKLAELEKPKPMTNEEWLRSATTEQLAEFIVNLTLLDKYKLYDQMESAEYEHGIGVGAKKVIVEWLKQPHTQGEKNEKEKIETKNQKAEEKN